MDTDRDTGESHLRVSAEIGVMHLRSKEHRISQQTTSSEERDLKQSSSQPKRNGLADTLILDFEPPEL